MTSSMGDSAGVLAFSNFFFQQSAFCPRLLVIEAGTDNNRILPTVILPSLVTNLINLANERRSVMIDPEEGSLGQTTAPDCEGK